ncbi:hypothetical protein BH09ACT4_BH09ACT4_24680 [soil metagenome]
MSEFVPNALPAKLTAASGTKPGSLASLFDSYP